MTLSLIVAMDQNRVIGKNNQLPWHLPEDLKRFKQITMGHKIVMGRKTFESIGKPLPGRENIVLTRSHQFNLEGAQIIHDLDTILKSEEEIFILGGAEIFQMALPRANKLYLTLIQKNYEGDTYFPEFDLEKDFQIKEDSGELISAKNQIPYRFVVAVRK